MIKKSNLYFLFFIMIFFVFLTNSTYGADTASGTLIGEPTYTRIFTGEVDPDCNATSTFSGTGVDVQYAVIPIRTTNPSGENLIATVNPAGTGIIDSTLSLYCNFDPANADLNLVAYDDDGGDGLLSAFTAVDGAFLRAGETYWIVLSLFAPSPGSIGDGTYQIDFGGEVRIGEVPSRSIPTISEWGAIILTLILIGSAIVAIRRRQKT